jgi:hypothetical protein
MQRRSQVESRGHPKRVGPGGMRLASERTVPTRMICRRRQRLSCEKYDIKRRVGAARGTTIPGGVNNYPMAAGNQAP